MSYSRRDLARVELLTKALERDGWSVWWDREIATGASFDRAIEQAINDARVVIVGWSHGSVGSDWVRAEAAYALEKNKLLPVRFDDAVPPLRFIHTQALDLSTWDGSSEAPAYRKLLADIAGMVG